MRKFLSRVFVLAGMVAMAACGGGGDGSKFETPGGSGNTPTGGSVTSLNVLTSATSIQSASTTPIDITAYATNASNNLVSGALVTFSASSGQIQVSQATTDTGGVAKATLSPAGDPTNRDITVTATSGTVSATVTVSVTGSQLTVQGPNAMVLQQTGTYALRLIDSAGNGIKGRTITLSSKASNTLSASTVTTDASGNANFTVKIANAGADTITATGMGITTTVPVSVNADLFSFQTPNPDTEVALGDTKQVTIKWVSGGTPVSGQNVSFAVSRGAVSAPTALTDANGNASVTVQSDNAGGAVVTANGVGGATATIPLEFVATTADRIEVQPTVFTLGPTQETTLTATVRDPKGNLVKNKVVTFSLQDNTGGKLNTASGVTDSQGRVQTTYKAGSSTSATNGVTVTATVQGTTVSDAVNLTVAQAQLFITLGTGNTIQLFSSSQYAAPYSVAVTDANGKGVAGVTLSMSVLSTVYVKGTRAAVAGFVANPFYCADEDKNHNGVLDRDPDPTKDEDFNGSGRIEAGNIATVAADMTVTGSKGFTTNDDGFAYVRVIYPKEYAYYLQVQLDAKAGVSGTEYVRSANFVLLGTKTDFDDINSAPGPVSPFGTQSCNSPN